MGNDLPDRFKQLEERVIQSIFIGHKVTSPMLFGVKSEGQLGGRNEILEAYELFKETYIQGRQQQLLNSVNDIFEYKGLSRSISVEELRPLQRELPLTEPTLLSVLDQKSLVEYVSNYYGVTIDIEKNINENNADELTTQKFEKQIIDYFEDKGEPASDYEIVESFPVHLGESGDVKFEIDELQVEFADPADKTLAEVAKILKANPKITIAEIAKVIKQQVSVVESAIKSLTKKGMIAVESTGIRVLPAATSIIRLLPKPNEVLLVKYQYGLRLDMSGDLVISSTRDFCRNLAQRNRLYTKKEIEGMRNDMTVSFISDIRDVWKYRGGWSRNKDSDVSFPYCRHIWNQVVVKQNKK
jgi:hypothetical protein